MRCPHAAAEATEAAAPEATEAPTRRIAGTPTHGYELTREAGMSLISLNVRFQGQPGPHLLATSFSQFDPKLPIGGRFCCDAQRGIFYNDVIGSPPQTKGST
jgi:hypothetical protein